MPDRPGALSAVTASLAAHGVDIVRLDVVSHDGESVVDDLLLAATNASDIGAAVAGFLPEVVVRTFEGLPGDPTIEMGSGLRGIAIAPTVGEAQMSLLMGAASLLRADHAVLLTAAPGGELDVTAATCDVPGLAASAPFAGRWALERVASTAFPVAPGWAPAEVEQSLGAAWVAVAPCGELRLLMVTRSTNIAFYSGELERLQTFAEAAQQILAMKGDLLVHGFALAGNVSELPPRSVVLQNHVSVG
jgi:hypothetical protein